MKEKKPFYLLLNIEPRYHLLGWSRNSFEGNFAKVAPFISDPRKQILVEVKIVFSRKRLPFQTETNRFRAFHERRLQLTCAIQATLFVFR
ncbi:hypothetical protein CEXT_386851 [Caerostris extrusa]|uniref:Uncharacterized protein n=1 Tax=Caerostris extrusa TaxID=172846 RepID=A0AAV4NPF2_CAEEX|nr:hypothetical protein CEXT_386851 [Caerostris extrusa]